MRPLTLLLALFLSVACVPDRPPDTPGLPLGSIPSFPSDWVHKRGAAHDTAVGSFRNSMGVTINYDIGELSGEYASRDWASPDWIRSAWFRGVKFSYMLVKDRLYVTFPNEGPANFWSTVADKQQLDYVLELLLKYRRDLLDY